MTGLEVPAFIVGLTGLATVFDKSCEIWKTISDAGNFGAAVASWLSKLEMEFYRFIMWWTALEHLAGRSGRTGQRLGLKTKLVPIGNGVLLDQLLNSIGNPLIKAATSIQEILEKSESILRENKSLNSLNTTKRPRLGDYASNTVQSGLVEIKENRQDLIKKLGKGVTWFTRLKHDAAPWKTSDNELLTAYLESFIYWNDSLYGILPTDIRDSVLRQGISGYIVDSEEQVTSITSLSDSNNDRNVYMSQTAKLRMLRRKLVDDFTNLGIEDQLDSMNIDANDVEFLVPQRTARSQRFHFVNYWASDAGTNSIQLLESYPYTGDQMEDEELSLLRRRLLRLSYVLKHLKADTISTLDTVGFTEIDDQEIFGMLYNIPANVSRKALPITLSSLLDRKTSNIENVQRFPPLEQRMQLAAALASSIYTFMLTKWYHESFQASNIAFLAETNTDGTTRYNLTRPYVFGFHTSRPDGKEEISTRMLEKRQEMYLHPDLITTGAASSRPKFRRSYEVYSFGLLLVEIGFWGPLDLILSKYRGNRLSPAETRKVLIEKCQSELACWTGQKYLEATLACLKVGLEEEGAINEDMNDFYWNVVFKLIECTKIAE